MFQVEVLEGGPQMFNCLAYKEKHPSTLAFVQSQFENISNTLNEAGRQFYAGLQSVFDAANSSEAMRRARLAMQKVANVFQPDIVRSVFELNEIQSSQLVMQRWIMANPVVRSMYHEQRCDGFSETFVDRFPGQIGENHYDYRRVMHGMVQDDSEHDWKASFYLDELFEGDRELEFDEQIAIRDTWEVVEAYLKRGEDPTSPFGNKL